MRKIMMLAGALSLMAVPAMATTPQKYDNQVSQGAKQTAQVPTRVCTQPSSADRIRKYDPDPSAHAVTPVCTQSSSSSDRIRKYDPNPS